MILPYKLYLKIDTLNIILRSVLIISNKMVLLDSKNKVWQESNYNAR